MSTSHPLGMIAIAVLCGSAGLAARQPARPEPQRARAPAELEFIALHDAYLAKYKPLFLTSSRAWWDATTTGADEAFARRKEAENALVELHSDRAVFRKLQALQDRGTVTDPTLARQLDVMVMAFRSGQADTDLQKRIVGHKTEIEQVFNTHRSQVGGKHLTENEVRKILAESRDSAEVEAAWKGYMKVGAKVAERLRTLAKLRNEMATQLGFRDFYAMKLALSEIDENELLAVFADLDRRTRAPFAAIKGKIDNVRAARFGVSTADLRPWHFGDLFFQEAPPSDEANLDDVFKDQDLLALARDYYAGMGLPVDDILDRSDLYERPGKTPHAFAADMDRAGDIRILCNLEPNLYWADTLLHELGHAVYDKYINADLPFILRTPSHGITTEGYAMMMGTMVKNTAWLTKVRRLPSGEARTLSHIAHRSLHAEKLIFCRWTQVMLHFERGLYADPNQDLGKLWWSLKQRHQLLEPPADLSRPDYGAKMHILTHPVYYHNYMLGDLFASQVHRHLAKTLLRTDDPGATCFFGRKDVGAYLREHVFAPGKLYSWSELTRRATGASLSAEPFAQQYVVRPDGDAPGE